MKNTKSIILVLIALFLVNQINAQIETKLFKSYGGRSGDYANALCMDKAENVYIAGALSNSTKDFGSKKTEIKGSLDIFLAKYNKRGKLKWLKTPGSVFTDKGFITDRAAGLCVDADGNVYMTGTYAGEAVFDNVRIRSNKSTNIFIAKYSTKGKLVWVKGYGGHSADLVDQIIMTKDGNLAMTGIANGNSQILPDQTRSSGFLAKIDSKNGDVLWVRNYGFSTRGKTLASDSKGNIYVGVDFDKPITIQDKKITSNGKWDILVFKYSLKGKLKWYKHIGGKGIDDIAQCRIDRKDGLLISGIFDGEVHFGDNQYMSKGGRDIFIANYSSDGEFIWANTFGSKGFDYTKCLDISKDNSILLTGKFENQIVFNLDTLTSQGRFDSFILSLDENVGSILSYYQFSSKGQIEIRGLAQNLSGDIFATGVYTKSITTSSDTYFSNGSMDLFFTELDHSLLGGDNLNGLQSADGFSIKISPNPTNGLVSIKLINLKDNAEIKILSPIGRTIYHKIIAPENNSIDLTGMSKGIYFVKVMVRGIEYTEKIVFQ